MTAPAALWPFARPTRSVRYPARPYRDLPPPRSALTKTDRYALAA